MAADLHVVWTAGRSLQREFCANLTVMRSRLGVEWQHVKARHEMLDRGQVIGATRRFLRAMVQLAERDARDTNLLGQ